MKTHADMVVGTVTDACRVAFDGHQRTPIERIAAFDAWHAVLILANYGLAMAADIDDFDLAEIDRARFDAGEQA